MADIAIGNVQSARKSFNHNLVNSLYVIRGIAESYLENIKDPAGLGIEKQMLEKATRALSKTMEQANRLIEMIHRFRALTYYEPGTPKTTPPVALSECLQRVLRVIQLESPFQRITVLKILPSDLPPVTIEREHLETILYHLIYNARQALNEMAGIITIEAEEKFYLSPKNKAQQRFAIRISDNGPGISYEDLPHIFDPFFTTKSTCEGNGLGLYLVKKLVEINKGVIRVESVNAITSFYIEFPN